jgi:inner membrane transporter RhtA
VDASQLVARPPAALATAPRPATPARTPPGRHRFVSTTGHGIAARTVPATALLLSGCLTNQLGAALATTLFGAAGPFGTAALRLVCSGAVLLIWCRPSLRMPARTALLVLAYGAIIGIANVMFYSAVAQLPLGIAATVEFLGPLVLALVNSRSPAHVLAVLLAGGGVALISWTGGAMDWPGVCCALVAGAAWACYVAMSAPVGRWLPGSNGLALGLGIGGLCALPVGISHVGISLFRLHTLAIGAGVALLSSALPYSLEFKALQRVPKRVYGVLASLEPAVAALAGLVLLDQTLEPTQWLGLVTVVAASVVISLHS